ncbi:MAG TPA: hypothetical protein VN924_24975 [Bryobacteraceae bacterium]|nr:hypothetical protein [Bryobacteraceae bacterium]
MPAVLALFGSLIVVVLTAWINTRMLSAQIEAVRSEIGALRAETRQGFAELDIRLMGRAVAALAGDPAILERSGQLFSSWELGCEYRFTDTDRRRPDWGASKIDFSKHPEQLLRNSCSSY